MLNVAHVKNVTIFCTLIENMSRTGLYDCHIFNLARKGYCIQFVCLCVCVCVCVFPCVRVEIIHGTL